MNFPPWCGLQMSDGRCSYWIDGWPWGTGEEWVSCCARHDAAYGAARHFSEYLQAHFELARCVSEVSPLMAFIMLIGTVAGTLIFGRKKLPNWWSQRQ